VNDLNQIQDSNELLALALSNAKYKKQTTEIKNEKPKNDFDFSIISSPGMLYLAAMANSRK